MAIQNRDEARKSFKAGVANNQTWFQSFKATVADFVRGFSPDVRYPIENKTQRAGDVTRRAFNTATVSWIAGCVGVSAGMIGTEAAVATDLLQQAPFDLGESTMLFGADNPESINRSVASILSVGAAFPGVVGYATMDKLTSAANRFRMYDPKSQIESPKVTTLDQDGQVFHPDAADFGKDSHESDEEPTNDASPVNPDPKPS